MASYLLYIITGVVLALMAARHLLALRRTVPKPDDEARPGLLHALDGKGARWAEQALCGTIFLFGFWMALTASLLFIAGLLHSLWS
jgi:hypothetical protein